MSLFEFKVIGNSTAPTNCVCVNHAKHLYYEIYLIQRLVVPWNREENDYGAFFIVARRYQ